MYVRKWEKVGNKGVLPHLLVPSPCTSNGWGLSWELGAQSRSPTGMLGAQLLEPSPLPPSVYLQEAGVRF